MAPSKAWMDLVDDRLSAEFFNGNISKREIYLDGVNKFLDYAFSRTGGNGEIRCPCTRCCNTYPMSREVVHSHLKTYGIIRNYRFWYHHGEVSGEPESDSEVEQNDEPHGVAEEGNDAMEELMMDLFPQFNSPVSDTIPPSPNESFQEEPNAEALKFYKLLDDFRQPLYPGSNVSKLSALVKLFNIKNMGKWTNKSFTKLLELLGKDFMPENSTLPSSYYESKKIIKELGLSYKKIDACKNDCMLYWKEDVDAEFCKVCERSRWKKDKHSGESIQSAKGKKIPEKTMRYFPLKPRLQRLYMCRKLAAFCTWHDEGRVDDGVMRHPADSKAWKHFDETYPSFASEPRNVRLCLAGDGFQPFGNMRTSYSIWPIFLVPLNLPPWMCTKQQNVLLSMLIPGPEGPGDAIDVYLQPLIEELIDLWEDGVDSYDASTKTNFKLRAALLWMVHDFPAYGNLSGYSTKGRLACPVCHKETCSSWLKKGNKFSYMGHRRFLPEDDRWRRDKTSFDGTRERRGPPTPLTGDEVLQQVHDLEGITLSKDPSKKTKISHSDRGDNWNKKSIFFKLPYFKSLLLRHNLDVMHIEKNICDSIIGTLLNIIGKTKDNLNSRLDLQEMNLKPHLHPFKHNGKDVPPEAPYVLPTEKKNLLLQFFKDLKVPDSFSSNISRCVNLKERKLSGLKPHDCHVILNHILPLALRGLVPKTIYEPLVELSQFFQTLNSKALSVEKLEQLEPLIARTLCKLEMEFPPSFFDAMVHLPIHLASEALIGGPTVYRWMYQFERYIKFLKSLVRNMARPEGSIAEGYLAYEFITLCTRYLDDVETIHNRPGRINDTSDHEKFCFSVFNYNGRLHGTRKTRDLDMHELQQAHIYVLRNCDEVQPFLSEYNSTEEGSQLQPFTPQWNQKFILWFREKAHQLYSNDKSEQQEDLLSLSRGPLSNITCFTGSDMHGFRFRIESRDRNRCTQNSGVAVISEGNMDDDTIEYYGVLIEILELQFLGGRRVPLFRCKWVDIFNKSRGIKINEYGLVSVNFKCLLRTDEPFILASQASQVFFVRDNLIKGWHLVVKVQPRDTYDVPPGDSDDEGAEPEDDDGDEEDVVEDPSVTSLSGKRKL